MAKKKLIITSSCRFEGRHLEKGTIVEVDIEDKKEATRLAPLVHAGRVALHTKDTEESIKSEIEAEEARIARITAQTGGGDKDGDKK